MATERTLKVRRHGHLASTWGAASRFPRPRKKVCEDAEYGTALPLVGTPTFVPSLRGLRLSTSRQPACDRKAIQQSLFFAHNLLCLLSPAELMDGVPAVLL